MAVFFLKEERMERIVIGKTGLEVARLGFGGIPIQRVEEESRAVETVLHAVESGVDFIDTARAYTKSERRIGMAINQTDREVVLASKSTSRTAKGLRADLEMSLKQLQRTYIDLYQCHFVQNVDVYEKVVGPGGAFEGLVKAKEEGLIGHIGITSHSLDLLDRVLEDGFFETIMVCFSLLEPGAEEKIFPKAKERGVGIIAMKPFSGGVINDAKLALKYVLSQPDIVILAGVESKELFDENWRIFRDSCELDKEEKRQIEEIRKKHGKDFCRRCDYCQPCTEGIPIHLILHLPSMVKRMGKEALTRGWRPEAIEKARHCSRCGECEERCPYQLPIPDLIKERVEWVDQQLSLL